MVQPSDDEVNGAQKWARKSDKKVTFRVSDYLENGEEDDSYAPAQKF